jgi:hypothetical protein
MIRTHRASGHFRLLACGSLTAFVITVSACAAQSESSLSPDERVWCTDRSNASVNVTAVAFEMDRLKVPEPSPGYLRARLQSRGYTTLGDSTPSWALAALGDPELIDEVATDQPAAYRQACRAAYEARGSILNLVSPST